ncbi:MAG TPA: hypothetical protein VLH61_10525 [Bacteroidales bacterium]|nr:hypothetical protein [Bacteroidales bacterium]
MPAKQTNKNNLFFHCNRRVSEFSLLLINHLLLAMKNMKPTENTFDAVKFMRQEREMLSKKLSKMTKEEIFEYFKKLKALTTIKP